MCLLVVLSRVVPGTPLVVAANRDERLERPARAMTVLRAGAPRVLGGVDELAGGTWLAVNERGVVAGLTNLPVLGGRDPAKRSRGELPLALASHGDAASAAVAVGSVRPDDYNPCWLLVGDRRSLFYVDLTGGQRPVVSALGPGVHVLGNSPLGAPSPKVRHVQGLVAGALARGRAGLLDALADVLSDHTITSPDGDPGPGSRDGPGRVASAAAVGGARTSGTGGAAPGDRSRGAQASATPLAVRRPETSACCVHADEYGTRSSLLVAADGADAKPPALAVADGPPCRAAFADVTALWTQGVSSGTSGAASR